MTEKVELCLICCKSCENSQDLVAKTPKTKTALSFLLRELDVKESRSEVNLSFFGTCLDCSCLLESYAELYDDWKRLEIQLQWSVFRIAGIMESADRVPARVAACKLWTENSGILTHIRRNLKRKCKRFRLKCMPQIRLEKIVDAPKVELKEETLFQGDDNDIEPLFLGWFSSLLAVTILSDPLDSKPRRLRVTSMSEIDDSLESDDTSCAQVENQVAEREEVASPPSIATTADATLNVLDGDDNGKETVDNHTIQVKFDTEEEEAKSDGVPVEEAGLSGSSSETSLESSSTGDSVKEKRVNRSLRRVNRCPTCHATFVSKAKLDIHKSSCLRCSDSSSEDESRSCDTSQAISLKTESAVDAENDTDAKRQEDQPQSKETLEKASKPKPVKPRTCPHCQKQYVDYPSLALHLRVSHGNGAKNGTPFRKLVISHPDQGLTLDDFTSPTKTPFCCTTRRCRMGFMTKTELESHSKLHGSFKCKLCEIEKRYALDLAIHELTHSNSPEIPKKIFCSRCKHVATSKVNCIQHFLEDHLGLQMDKFLCPICKFPFLYFKRRPGMQYAFVKIVLRHHAAHHGTEINSQNSDQLFHCEELNCRAFFVQKIQLMRHVAEIHGRLEEDMYTCVDCGGKRFKDTRALQKHRAIKHNVDQAKFQFVCDHDGCQERFERAIHLESHKRRHSIKIRRDFKCDIDNCRKGFPTQLTLDIHKKTHREKQTKFICEECGKVSHNPHFMYNHKLTHVDPKDWAFSCSVCGKKSQTNQALQAHMRLHSSTKSFVCHECGQEYVHRHNLRHHLKSKHGIVDEGVKKRKRLIKESSLKGKKFKRVKLVKTDNPPLP